MKLNECRSDIEVHYTINNRFDHKFINIIIQMLEKLYNIYYINENSPDLELYLTNDLLEN